MLSAKTLEALDMFVYGDFCYGGTDWLRLDYRLPEHAGAAAAAAERVMEFAECTVWVKRLADGTLTATFSACNGRPELYVYAFQCVRLPGFGIGLFEDVDVMFVRAWEWGWGCWCPPCKISVAHVYLFSVKRGLCRPHPLQDMADWPTDWL